MKFNPIFFDLDGTITDSEEGIIRSVQYALDYFNVSVERGKLLPFIGPPLQDSFALLFPDDENRVNEAVSKYREYYSERGIFENRLYDGVRDLLEQLAESGQTLALATTKPEPFAVRIVEHFDIGGYFACVAGAQLNGPRNNKAAVLRHACQQLGVAPSSGGIMVGDRKYDVLGAHEVGMPCAAVLYGYGPESELTQAGADWLCHDMEALRKLLTEQ